MEELFSTMSTEETEALGERIAEEILSQKVPPFVALYGDLGTGKTAFVRGVARVIAPGATVRSPTFALVNEYRGGSKPLFHFDMYRITGEDDLYSIGFEDYPNRNGIILVEWSENIPFALPETYLKVTITKPDLNSPDLREIRVETVKENVC